jgi:hypothetical protein
VIDKFRSKRKRVLPYPRESNETPRENAFCLVAPSVRLSDFAILPADVFFLARLFKSRTSAAVHARRFAFPAIKISYSQMQVHIDLVVLNVNAALAVQTQSLLGRLESAHWG